MLGGAGVVFFPHYLYLPTVSKSSLGSGVSAYNDFRWRYGCDLQVSESFEIVPVPPSSIPAAPERPRSTRCHDRSDREGPERRCRYSFSGLYLLIGYIDKRNRVRVS